MSAIDETAFIWVGYVVIVIVVFLSLFAILNKMADNTAFKQEKNAREIALIENILLANEYSHDFSLKLEPGFEYEFSDCRVSVKKENTPDKPAAEYFCADNLNVNKFYDVEGDTKKLAFKIENGRLNVVGETNG